MGPSTWPLLDGSHNNSNSYGNNDKNDVRTTVLWIQHVHSPVCCIHESSSDDIFFKDLRLVSGLTVLHLQSNLQISDCVQKRTAIWCITNNVQNKYLNVYVPICHSHSHKGPTTARSVTYPHKIPKVFPLIKWTDTDLADLYETFLYIGKGSTKDDQNL